MSSHLTHVNMTYIEHFRFSGKIAIELFIGSIFALIHACSPNLYDDSSTRLITKWHRIFEIQHTPTNSNDKN